MTGAQRRDQLEQAVILLGRVQAIGRKLEGDMTEREQDIWQAHVTKPVNKVLDATDRMLFPNKKRAAA